MEPSSPEVISFLTAIENNPSDRLELPNRELIHPDLITTADRISEISGAWNPVEIYTADPTDIESERIKVFDAYKSGDEYNPELSYPHADNLDLSDARVELNSLLIQLVRFHADKLLDKITRIALARKIRDDMATCDLADGIKNKNERKISLALDRKYPGTDEALMKTAQEFYKRQTIEGEPVPEHGSGMLTSDEYGWLKNKEFSPEEQKKAFEYILSAYGILREPNSSGPGYEVVIDENATSLDVRDKSIGGPTLFIPRNRAVPMTGDKLLPLLAHEIEGHARQSMIGSALFIVGGGKLKFDDEQLYEGYGLRLEADIKNRLFGIKDTSPRILYPFAVQMAENGSSFYDIFSDQVERHLHIQLKIPHDSPLPNLDDIDQHILNAEMKKAWLVTYRVMRGHTDMANPQGFAMAKDLGYLRGWLIDKELVEHGYGHVNESAVIAKGGLSMIAQFDFDESKIPENLKHKDAVVKYWKTILKPEFLTTRLNN